MTLGALELLSRHDGVKVFITEAYHMVLSCETNFHVRQEGKDCNEWIHIVHFIQSAIGDTVAYFTWRRFG